MTIEPTTEQQTILDAGRVPSGHMMIRALAGTGKTATLEMLTAVIPSKTCLYLVFNKRNADEAKKRMATTTAVKTFNALGHSIWGAQINKRLAVESQKCGDILREIINGSPRSEQALLWGIYALVNDGVSRAKAVGYIPEGKFPNANHLCTRLDFCHALEEEPDDLTLSLIDEVLFRSIKAAYAGTIDFNDQVYMTALFASQAMYPKYPTILVDEYQDLNPVNHVMVARLLKGGGRLIGVGDQHQCHPPGTLVFVTGKGHVPIETLTKEDRVAYFSTKIGRFVGVEIQGREIEHIHTSQYSGELIKVTVDDRSMEVTPNHKCIVRIHRDAHEHLLYLMKKGNQFRLGISRIRRGSEGNSGFGPTLRARQEKADAVWLLETYINEVQARAHERYYAAEFGIPTALFLQETDQECLDLSWELIGDNEAKGNDLLRTFDRDPSLPFWTRGSDNFIGFHRVGVIHACNLMPEIMTMLTHPSGAWHQISLERRPYSGPVYGITVAARKEEKHRVYLANGILVHNSIYGFRGAKAGGMAEAITAFDMRTFGLTMSFRCPGTIVRGVHWHVPEFKASREGGSIEYPVSFDPALLPETATILCRNNAPLFSLALRLLAFGRSVSVSGSDVGPRLIKTLRKLGDDDMKQREVLEKISIWLADKLERSSTTAQDMADCMRVFARFGPSLGTAIAYAEHLFSATGSLQLMTGHKSKGLEWPDVFILDQHLCKPTEQDNNVKYVMSTRSSDRLTFIRSDGILWPEAIPANDELEEAE